MKEEEEFIRHNWEFMSSAKRMGESLAAGNYEWPFEMILPGKTPESIEGLPESWVIYRMKAKIERGLLQQNAVARRHVRVVRTLDLSSLELVHEMVGAHVQDPDRTLTQHSLLKTSGRISLTTRLARRRKV